MKEIIKTRLELINNEIEIYKKNIVEEVEKENMVVATNYLMTLRDLKEQQLLLKELVNIEG